MCCSYSISVSRMVRRDYQQPLDWSWEESWHNVQMPPNMAKEQRVVRISCSIRGSVINTCADIAISRVSHAPVFGPMSVRSSQVYRKFQE